VALRFGRKKPEDSSGDGGDDNGKEAAPFVPQPEKARQWFDQAKSMADRYNYEAALLYYANGVRLDPKLMSAHESTATGAARPPPARTSRSFPAPTRWTSSPRPSSHGSRT
jgi:hypothetical protein